MEKKFGWCFIGCGTLAKKVARQLCASGRHRVVSVYSRTFERADEFAKAWGAEAFRSAEDAMTADGVDAVYVVTPHNSHYEYTKLALELGRPCLNEKPFTVSAAETEELISLARERGLYLAEAMWTWFSPVANAVKRWVDDGEFGKIDSVRLYCRTMGRYYAPRVTDPNTAGGALLDMGVYALTYLYRLFGMPSEISCAGRVERGIDWEEEVDLAFPSGLKCHVSIAITDFKGLEELSIRGSGASLNLKIFHRAGWAKLHRANGADELVRGGCTYLNEFDIVASEIREGLTESRFVPLDATADVMGLLDECRRQMGLRYPFEK